MQKEKTPSPSRLKEIKDVLLQHRITEGLTPEKLRLILEDLGPTFVKIGQIMALHSDILPNVYCEELLKLDSEVPPMPFADVLDVLKAAYPEPWERIFSHIEEKPLGSASIAQVHRARLQSGEEVILKIQRKNIEAVMERDIHLLKKATRLLPPIGDLKNLVDLGQVLDELWRVTREELDFLHEAENMRLFCEKNQGIAYIRMPKLFEEYTTRQVLVMEYIGGAAITDLGYLTTYGYDPDEIGRKLVNHYIKQIMEDGFFHADPHPGNIRVLDGKIVWIDMGMMGRLSEAERSYLSEAVEGIALNDISLVENAVLALGEFWSEPNKDQLYRGIREFLQTYGQSSFAQINIGEVLQNLMELMKKNKVRMPHGLTLLARGLSHMEGVLRVLAPDLNMLEIAADRIRESYMKSLDWKNEIPRAGWRLFRSLKKGIRIPALISDILKEYLQGRSRLNLELRSSDDLAWLLRYLVRNMVIGLWVTALIIGSSILCTTRMKPEILGLPWPAFFGFLAAGAIVLAVVLRHFSSRRKHKKNR